MKKIIKSVMILLILIFLMESGIRIFMREELVLWEIDTEYVPDTLIGFRHDAYSEIYIRRPSINNRTKLNNHGYHGPNFKDSKQDSTFRICIVGHSNETGLKTNGSESSSTLLQREFINNGWNVEIINCSQDGGSRDIQNIQTIKRDIVEYDPDLILLIGVKNIKEENLIRDSYKNYCIRYHKSYSDSIYKISNSIDEYESHKAFISVYNKSYLIRLMCRYYWNQDLNGFTKIINKHLIKRSLIKGYVTKLKTGSKNKRFTKNFSEEETIGQYKELNSFLLDKNIKLVLFNYSMSKEMGEGFKSNLKKEGVNCLKMDIPFEEEDFLKYDAHSNQVGLQKIAKGFYHELIKNEFIPEIFKKY